MLKQGQWLIVGMLTLALTAAGFAWWWNVRQTRRCLQFWGPEAALRIANAPKSEVLRFDEPQDVTESPLSAEPSSEPLVVDISHARGFSNVRRLMVQDRSFDWATERPVPTPGWTLALRFDDGQAASVVFLATDGSVVALKGKPGTATLDPAAAKILADFAAEQFAPSEQAPEKSASDQPER